MELTEQQLTAQKAAMAWWESGDDRPFLIQGYAGTGKSTTISAIAAAVSRNAPAYMAFTNKAARVLAKKVQRSLYCGTIHGAIYFITWHEAYEGALIKYDDLKLAIKEETDTIKLNELLDAKKKMQDDREIWTSWELQDGFAWDREFEDGCAVYNGASGGLVVVDECSMVRHDVGRDLVTVAANAGYRIIAVGDPGQLPPVVGRDYTGPLDDVSYFTPKRCACAPILTDVMRQGEGSNILKAATLARQGSTRIPWNGSFEALAILPRGSDIDVTAYDQVICGRHITRRNINAIARAALGFSGAPKPGDKMIAQTTSKNDGYSNGDIFTVQSFDNGIMTAQFDDDNIVKFKVKQTDFDDEKGTVAYAYAITCHKSQGSEYGKVLLYNEAYCFRDDAHKWLYTGITRAKDFLTVLQ